jgi:hypothetical protein
LKLYNTKTHCKQKYPAIYEKFPALEGHHHLTRISRTECYSSSYWGRCLNFRAWFMKNILEPKKKWHLVESKRTQKEMAFSGK